MDESKCLETLSDLLTRISANPYDLSLHAQHIHLASTNGMDDQATAARQMLTNFWPAGDEIWLKIIESRAQQNMETLDDALEVLALFRTAEEDYLSITLLQRHIDFLVDRFSFFNSSKLQPESMGDAFSAEWMSAALSSVVEKGAGHLTESHLLWDVYLNWEVEQLEDTPEEERPGRISKIEGLFLRRLKQPHSNHDQTFQLYSTFTTNYKPADAYEELLVTASSLKGPAVKAYERRERNEAYLAQSNFSLDAYNYYISYERRAKNIDLFVLTALYERAISEAARMRFGGINHAEIALRSFWNGYCDVLRIYSDNVGLQESVLRRAARSVPGSGEIWAKNIRLLESTESDVTTLIRSVSDIYDNALTSGLIQENVEDFVSLVLARAGVVKRTIAVDDEVEGGVEMLFEVLKVGISAIRAAFREGDPRYRLEKFLSELYINLAESPDLASAVWETTAKHYKTSYLAWTIYVESLIKQGKYDEARAIYKSIAPKNVDWPEMIFDAWVAFEHLHGTLEELQECLNRVELAQTQVNSRRAKEAQRAAYQVSQTVASSNLVAEETVTMPLSTPEVSAVTVEKDDRPVPGNLKKRKADEHETGSDTSKKMKTENAAPPKRDRENATVFVAQLPTSVTEQDLDMMFRDCGAIREIKITEMSDFHVATVEFSEKESVPAGLTKDKKRIDGQEISVHLAWQSTLYVTNFPEKADDAYIRQLFGQYGVIFDVRWPSKKYKMTRRFCYIQFTSPDAAQSALSLHRKELEPGLPLNVFISNPERKKERTDAGANDREVYVAGLSKFSTRDDLEKLFRAYGSVKEVRMSMNEAGRSKGFAFVEFEDEASASSALQANNQDLKNRRIAVTMADSRVRARLKNDHPATGLSRRADLMSRSVRIKGLPPATQEGLLQQALEKIAVVNRVEVFQDSGEAVVELSSIADAGRLLLFPGPLQFGGRTLSVFEEETNTEVSSNISHPPKKKGVFLPRATTARTRIGMGKAKKVSQQGLTSMDSNGAEKSTRAGLQVPTSNKGQEDFRRLLG
ncbi:hypothetical protein M0805_006250 [Coniferiporia weirii]|nr:hypothetical protein M0805_006250 [Coniferiporia weirii]